ncbi:MAG: methyltransferase domain-containing protein [Flavobacteriales bacterium]|nr:methyltransferase domain-containing protein [Flavobacteriales bacterium]
MDDFTLEGKALRTNLDILASINKWLGGNQVSLNGIQKLIKKLPRDQKLVIVDLGCGNGDMLRRVSKLGDRIGYQFKLMGIDANKDSIQYATLLSLGYKNITFHQMNIFSEEFKGLTYDIALSTLFLHHLNNEEIIDKLSLLNKQARVGIVVNDLHRNKVAYFLFNIISFFINNKIIRNDGLVSIRRGFKKDELINFANKLQIKSDIRWKWAFRYQWIMKTNI